MSNLAAKTLQEARERSYTGMATRKVARCTAHTPTALEVDTCPAVQLLMTKPSLCLHLAVITKSCFVMQRQA